MTTIRTAFPQSEVQSLDALRIDRLRLNPSDRDVTNLQITRGGPVVAGINVLTADIKAALGIDELGCGCDEADDNLKAAIARAEDAEAFGAAAVKRAEEAEAEALEQAKLVRTWADRAEQIAAERDEWKARAEKYDELANDLANELKAVAAKGDHWQERAEKAEANVEAAAKIAKDMRTWGWQRKVQDWGEKLDAALADKPAFTLPTEAGTFVQAENECGDRYEFELWTNGTESRWMDTSGGYSPLTAAELLGEFTAHRLIGADQ